MDIDEEKLEELKKQYMPDNSKLEDLIRNLDMGFVGPSKEKEEFLTLFKESQLYMPVIMSDDFFENIEDSKPGDVFTTTERSGFDINYITYDEDKKGVALFTSDEMMKSSGLQSSVIAMFMSDLAGLLKQTDRYSMIFINPFTDLYVDMPIDSFLNLFREPSEEEKKFFEALNEILNALREHSLELEDNMAFIVRSDDDFMKEAAVDGVFVPDIPFNVSSNPKFGEGMKYTNFLLFDKSKKVLPIGPPSEDQFNTVIAPGTEFILEKELDEFTRVWKCGAQPFYDE